MKVKAIIHEANEIDVKDVEVDDFVASDYVSNGGGREDILEPPITK